MGNKFTYNVKVAILNTVKCFNMVEVVIAHSDFVDCLLGLSFD